MEAADGQAAEVEDLEVIIFDNIKKSRLLWKLKLINAFVLITQVGRQEEEEVMGAAVAMEEVVVS